MAQHYLETLGYGESVSAGYSRLVWSLTLASELAHHACSLRITSGLALLRVFCHKISITGSALKQLGGRPQLQAHATKVLFGRADVSPVRTTHV